MTFSKSLAEWLVGEAKDKWGLEATARKIPYRLGSILELGQASKSKSYAIVSRQSGIVLRATLFCEGAALMADKSRTIRELWLDFTEE